LIDGNEVPVQIDVLDTEINPVTLGAIPVSSRAHHGVEPGSSSTVTMCSSFGNLSVPMVPGGVAGLETKRLGGIHDAKISVRIYFIF